MSVSSLTNRVSYLGNGTADTFSYTFRIFDEDHLQVTVRDPDGVETTLTKTTHYTVSGVGALSGGSVALVNGAFDWVDAEGDLDTDYVLVIRRVLPLKQETEFRNQGSFFPEDHEDAFDKQIMINQAQQDELDRSMKLAETIAPADFDPTLPASIVGQVSVALVTNATGDGFEEGPTADEISNAQGYATAASNSATAASGSATLASEWASKTDGQVATTDYSAKAWAIGGTGVTDTASAGASKEWAIETASTVDGSEYSAKEYAQGTQTRGAAGGGSAKDWAVYTGGTVDDTDYSAKYWAQQANQYLTADNVWGGTQIYNNLIGSGQTVDGSTTGSNQSISPASIIYALSNASLASIDNIVPTISGQVLILINSVGSNITIVNDSGGTAANRIKTGSGSDLTFKNNAALFLVYDNNATRWQVIGGAGGSDAIFASDLTLDASGDSIAVTTGVLDQTIRVQGNSVEAVLSTTPFSGSPSDLTLVTLIGVSDDYHVTITYNDASNGVVGNFSTIVLRKYQTARFRYSSTLARWIYVQ